MISIRIRGVILISIPCFAASPLLSGRYAPAYIVAAGQFIQGRTLRSPSLRLCFLRVGQSRGSAHVLPAPFCTVTAFGGAGNADGLPNPYGNRGYLYFANGRLVAIQR
jgi:hypothetical protein